MDLLQRLAHARALDRLQPTGLGAPPGSGLGARSGLPDPVGPAIDPSGFERREVVLSLAASGRPSMLGACLDRLVLPSGLALARDLVGLGAARGTRPVFIDTETTGLGGVAVPFMIGIAWYTHDSLTVTQWTLSRLGAEAQMLVDVLAMLRTLGPDPLVSFNGATFDLPLLRVRARRHGLCDRVIASGQVDHVDLLHPARRVHRGYGLDCRLSTLERDLLGLQRRGDIDSAEIPAVFWRSVQSPDDHEAQRQMQAVREHNVVDLVSLPALATRLARAIREPEDLERARRAARHFIKLGAHEQARLSLARWIEPGLAQGQRGIVLGKAWREAALELADLARRLGSRVRAAALWSAAWRQEPSCPFASEAWAKHLEHHVGDFAEALRVARASRLPCPRRVGRLESKLEKLGEPAPAQVVPAVQVVSPKKDPPPAPGPRASLDLRPQARLAPTKPGSARSPRAPRSELLSVVEDESGATLRYRLLR